MWRTAELAKQSGVELEFETTQLEYIDRAASGDGAVSGGGRSFALAHLRHAIAAAVGRAVSLHRSTLSRFRAQYHYGILIFAFSLPIF